MGTESKKVGWEHFSHQADIGIRGFGKTLEEAFAHAAIAMAAVITDPETIENTEKITISCQADDNEILFVDWLNALLYEMDIRKMLFAKFEVNITDGRLTATAWGQKSDVAKHSPAVEVKGATYTMLSVARDENENWIAQTVVDV